ncbi:hypothetical protein [Nitratifractor sp.]
MNDAIETIVLESIARINKDLDNPKLRHPAPDDPLFAELDSMAVLDLILEIEARLQEHLGRYVQIADERSMDPQKTPFLTVQSAIEHVRERADNG